MSRLLEGQLNLDLPRPPATSEGHTSWVYGLEQVRPFLVLLIGRSKDLPNSHWRASLGLMHNCRVLVSLKIQCLKGGGQLSEAD